MRTLNDIDRDLLKIADNYVTSYVRVKAGYQTEPIDWHTFYSVSRVVLAQYPKPGKRKGKK